MKRKIIVMGLAMVTGLPQAVCARSLGKEKPAQAYSAWNSAYMPHYGTAGSARPLLDHLSAPAALPRRNAGNAWRLEFAPPAAVAGPDDPLTAGDKRAGFSLKLDF